MAVVHSGEGFPRHCTARKELTTEAQRPQRREDRRQRTEDSNARRAERARGLARLFLHFLFSVFCPLSSLLCGLCASVVHFSYCLASSRRKVRSSRRRARTCRPWTKSWASRASWPKMPAALASP